MRKYDYEKKTNNFATNKKTYFDLTLTYVVVKL